MITTSIEAIARTAPPTAFVFERQPRWAPELERQFIAEDVRVVACRSLRDLTERSQGVSRGVMVLDLAAETIGCLRFLGLRAADPAAVPTFVVGGGPTAHLEWVVRELGATLFFATIIPGHALAALCRRQWSTIA